MTELIALTYYHHPDRKKKHYTFVVVLTHMMDEFIYLFNKKSLSFRKNCAVDGVWDGKFILMAF
jgi:hypothetical protein